MRRLLLCFLLCMAGAPTYASVADEVEKVIFEESEGKVEIKQIYRRCTSDSDCAAVLIMCRWRPVSREFQKHVTDQANKVGEFPCKWPKPPAQAPFPRCLERLCVIPSDGKYY